MADSDLDIKIRLKNEAEGALEELQKNLEKTKAVVDELGESSGPENLSAEVNKVIEVLNQFSELKGIDAIVSKFVELSQQANVTAGVFGKFIGDTITEFEAMAAQAAKTGDVVSSQLFQSIATGMKEFAALPEVGKSLKEFEKLNGSIAETGKEFELTAAQKDAFRKNLMGLGVDLSKAGQAQTAFNATVASAGAGFATSDLEKISAEYNKLRMALDPLVAAQIKLEEQTKLLDRTFKAGLVSPEEYAKQLKQIQDASEKTSGIMGFFRGKIAQLAAAFTLGNIATKAFDFALGKLHDAVRFLSEGIQLAARIEQLDIALSALAATGTATAEALNVAVESLERLGFSSASARENIIKMTQSGLELARVEELGAAAANQAIIAGRTREEVLSTVVTSIANLNLRMLRSIGIIVNQEAAELKFAESLEKTSSQLTRSQKQLALEAAALERDGKSR